MTLIVNSTLESKSEIDLTSTQHEESYKLEIFFANNRVLYVSNAWKIILRKTLWFLKNSSPIFSLKEYMTYNGLPAAQTTRQLFGDSGNLSVILPD